ncbi:MAG: hypothetical protein ACRDIE_15355, partial [Chloroflexota bacterium]
MGKDVHEPLAQLGMRLIRISTSTIAALVSSTPVWSVVIVTFTIGWIPFHVMGAVQATTAS